MSLCRSSRLALFAGWLLFAAGQSFGQFNGIQVNVNAMGNNLVGDAANEPSIAVDPTNPNRIAIGWRQFDTITSNFRQAGVAYSTDGGQSWTASVLDPGQFRSDPVLESDADGNFYYSSLSSVTSIEMFKSTNGGATWSSPVPAAGGDKQWIAIDRTSGIGRGNVYQHWNVQFTGVPDTNFNRTTNGGVSFDPAIAGPFPYMKWGTMDVGPDGTLYLAGATLNQAGHLFSKSTNAQDPNQVPVFSASRSINLGGTSSTGGVNPAGLLGQVTIATDHSMTPTRGNVYVLASVNPAGTDPLDVHFIRSSDGGNTWSAPVRVNNDPLGSTASQWFAAMAVAPNGRLDAVWNDTRGSVANSTSQLYYAYSHDAGVTWQGNMPISQSFNQSLGYPMQNKLGDYLDLVSDNTGVSIAYAATFTGGQDVYYRRVDAVILCDFDNNRLCNIDDLNLLLATGPIAGGVAAVPGVNNQFDLNGDGTINLVDRDAWLARAGSQNGLASPYRVADGNLDGIVDGSDFGLWNTSKFSSSLAWDRGDFNGDGIVDGSDFGLWNGNKFTSSDDFSAVPEPGVGLIGLLFLLAAFRHRARSS